jgi:hypothetical protein
MREVGELAVAEGILVKVESDHLFVYVEKGG